MTTFRRHAVSAVFVSLAVAILCTSSSHGAGARELLDVAGVRGGVCVHVGCGDGSLALAIATNGPFIVHGLDTNDAAIQGGRAAISALRAYGQVSLEHWTATNLPYADNVVNLLIVERDQNIPRDELLRVITPGGVVCVNENGRYDRLVKSRPAAMDEWTHWRHAPDRNPVSKDELVEVPRRIQWLTSHGAESKEMVTAGGRNFYVYGGALVVRDAFNGVLLWTNRVDVKVSPVAFSNEVFAVSRGTLVCFDAATGAGKRVYATAGAPQTIMRLENPRDTGGLLIIATTNAVQAIAASSGAVVWSHAAVSPRAMSASSNSIFLVSGEFNSDDRCTIEALDIATGRIRWERSDLPWASVGYRSCNGNGVVAFETGRFAVPKFLVPLMDKQEANAVHFLSAASGEALRDYEYAPAMRHDENVRAFFIHDRVAVHRVERDRKTSNLALFTDVRKEPELFPALPPTAQMFYCYPPVATERFFIYGQMSFTDWRTGAHAANQITRGTCGAWTEGVLPANGLIYIFPKSCNCFSMLHGFGALAPEYKKPVVASEEFVKGTAYQADITGTLRPGEWPILRGDEFRTGSSAAAVPSKLRRQWSIDVASGAAPVACSADWNDYPFSAGPLSPPVIAGGIVFITEPHAHRVLALDAANGRHRWRFVAEGRVDSPPTIYKGLCLFGTRTGWLYCLRAADGELVWKRRLAPADLRIVHSGQLESPWPVPGSVLVTDGKVFTGAGIHPLADGGLRVFAIDARSGRVEWRQTLDELDYDKHGGWHMRNGLEQDYFDLMVRDADKVALSRWVFDRQTGTNELLWHNAFYRLGTNGAYMQRGTWSYGHPMNRPRMKRPLLVASGNSVFGANRVRTKEGGDTLRLFRRDFQPGEDFNVIWDEQKNDTDSRLGAYFPANRIAEKPAWSAPYPGWIEAMVIARERLFVFAKDKLRTYAAADGRLLAEMPLEQPVWDGIAAAEGKLYVSTRAGRLLCLGE